MAAHRREGENMKGFSPRKVLQTIDLCNMFIQMDLVAAITSYPLFYSAGSLATRNA